MKVDLVHRLSGMSYTYVYVLSKQNWFFHNIIPVKRTSQKNLDFTDFIVASCNDNTIMETKRVFHVSVRKSEMRTQYNTVRLDLKNIIRYKEKVGALSADKNIGETSDIMAIND